MQMTTLTQGATDSIAQFQRIVAEILQPHMPHQALPFIDDIGVKGPIDEYNDKVLPGMLRFVMEHIQWLDGVLADLERVDCTVPGAKPQFCMTGLRCHRSSSRNS